MDNTPPLTIETIRTADLSGVWAGQHGVYPGDSWARDMWDGWLDPQRIVLVKTIKEALLRAHGGHVQPPESILEVGCGSGPNLRLFHGQWPSTDLTGLDVNKAGMEWGVREAGTEGWFWYGLHAQLDELQALNRQRDVVVTCYTLTYVDRSDINAILAQLLRLTKKALVIMEPMVPYGKDEKGYIGNLREGGQGYPEFWYDYLTRFSEILKGTGQVVEAKIDPMTPWGHLNGVVTVLPQQDTLRHEKKYSTCEEQNEEKQHGT